MNISHYPTFDTTYEGGFSIFSTSEGLVVKTARHELIDYGNELNNKNSDKSEPHFVATSSVTTAYGMMAISISYHGKSVVN